MIVKIISLVPYLTAIFFVSMIVGKRDKKTSREIIWASLRTTVQLILLAFALEAIFQSTKFVVVLMISFIMSFNSSFQIISRTKTSKYKIFSMIFFSTVLSLWPIAFILSYDKDHNSWKEARVLLPILGLVLGNSFNGVSIAINNFLTLVKDKSPEVMSLLALGASHEEALRPFFYSSLRSGITPLLNSMLAMGIVSIPGMMAGQLIANSTPFDASLIQIKLMLSLLMGLVLFIYVALKFLKKKIFLPSGELCLE